MKFSFPNAWIEVNPIPLDEAWELLESLGWRAGRNIDARQRHESPLHFLFSHLAFNSPHDKSPSETLSESELDYLGCCKAFINAGVPINSAGEDGATPLMEAASAPIYFTALFLHHGADPNLCDDDGNQWPYYFATAIPYFCTHWEAKMQWLKSSGLDLTHQNKDGQDLLEMIEAHQLPFKNSSRTFRYEDELVNLLKEARILKNQEALEKTLPKGSKEKLFKHL